MPGFLIMGISYFHHHWRNAGTWNLGLGGSSYPSTPIDASTIVPYNI
ncbi:hypothetical protein PIIN_10764 [Serendipita indica DSM 11827]|uniref:Uncharacterized protein n=1 Tax=Serendipita indica (strain DSM 11827) TaxID=1109443 RepID=G4TZN4_SERID|nr:hypothetical protein PIIN_10764 [Serendipita indica DSM 11827]